MVRTIFRPTFCMDVCPNLRADFRTTFRANVCAIPIPAAISATPTTTPVSIPAPLFPRRAALGSRFLRLDCDRLAPSMKLIQNSARGLVLGRSRLGLGCLLRLVAGLVAGRCRPGLATATTPPSTPTAPTPTPLRILLRRLRGRSCQRAFRRTLNGELRLGLIRHLGLAQGVWPGLFRAFTGLYDGSGTTIPTPPLTATLIPLAAVGRPFRSAFGAAIRPAFGGTLAAPAAFTALKVRRLSLFFQKVGDVQEGVALQAHIDKSRLHARQHAGHTAVIDRAGEGVFVLALVVNLA